jgi:hypothetical protein
LYSVAKSWERIGQGEDALTAMRRSVFGMWTGIEEAQPLRDAPSDRPVPTKNSRKNKLSAAHMACNSHM